MNELLLEVRDLRLTFHTDSGRVPAVDGVSFSLGRGRVLAVIGESGCGKSVIGKSLLRLMQERHCISQGQILLHPPGESPLDVLGLAERSAALRRIRGKLASMIFQEPQSALSPVHTIGQQICEAILVHQPLTRAQAERIAVDMLAQIGVDQPAARMNQYPHEISGGMRQRVVIAMALVCKPLLLVADEPTTALDVLSQTRVFASIRDLQDKHGTAVLLITHDIDIARQLADEILVIYCGRVLERGPAHRLMTAPKHPYTQGLLASQPRNASREKGQRMFSIPGAVPLLTALPAGCHFHPRCAHAQPGKCDQAAPKLRSVSPGHEVACVRLEEFCNG